LSFAFAGVTSGTTDEVESGGPLLVADVAGAALVCGFALCEHAASAPAETIANTITE